MIYASLVSGSHIWLIILHDLTKNPLLRTYVLFKQEFKQETYLKLVKDTRYRIAISRFRASSHKLEIEVGRYVNKRVQDRLCNCCHEVEDEKHFLFDCTINFAERRILFAKIEQKFPLFLHMNKSNKFIYIMTHIDSQLLTWFGKFLYDSFKKRDEFFM